MANLRGLTAGLCGVHIPAIWIQTATVAGSIFAVTWVASRSSRKARGDELFLVAVVTSVFVSYYLFIHDLAVLLIPILLTLNRFISYQTGDVLSRLAKWAAALTVIAPMLVFLIPGHFYLVSLLICGFLLILVQISRLDIVAVDTAADLPAGT